jgi:hypothetical protein
MTSVRLVCLIPFVYVPGSRLDARRHARTIGRVDATKVNALGDARNYLNVDCLTISGAPIVLLGTALPWMSASKLSTKRIAAALVSC